MTRREETEAYWQQAFKTKEELLGYVTKHANQPVSDAERLVLKGDIVGLLCQGIKSGAFQTSKPEDVQAVEATATMHAGAHYTVPCLLESVAPFPAFREELIAAVLQLVRLRFPAYETIHQCLIAEVGPAGEPHTQGICPPFDFKPNLVGELLLGGEDDIRETRIKDGQMLNLANLIRPWERVRGLDTCRPCVVQALNYYNSYLKELEGPQPIARGNLDNQVEYLLGRFMAECEVHMQSHAVVDNVEEHLAQVSLGGGPTHSQRKLLRLLLRCSEAERPPDMLAALPPAWVAYVERIRQVLWPGLDARDTPPRNPTGPLYSDSRTGQVGVASLHLHVVRWTTPAHLLPAQLSDKHDDGCLRAAEIDNGEQGLPAQLRCEAVLESLGARLVDMVRWLQLLTALPKPSQQQQQPQQQQQELEQQVQYCWGACRDMLGELTFAAQRAALAVSTAEQDAQLTSIQQQCPQACKDVQQRCLHAFEGARDAVSRVQAETCAGMPPLEAAQHHLLSRMEAMEAAQRVFGGAMWELRAARAQMCCECCSECCKGAGKWLRRQEKQRERLQQQEDKDADLEVVFRQPASGAVRSYCPLADATKRAFVKVDGMLLPFLVNQVMRGDSAADVRQAVLEESEAGLPWGWQEVVLGELCNEDLTTNKIRDSIGASVAYWLRVSPADFNRAARKRKKATLHRLKDSLQQQRRKVKRGKRKHRDKAKAARDRLRSWLQNAKAKGPSRISPKDYPAALYTDGVGARIVLRRHFAWDEVVCVGRFRVARAQQPPQAQSSPTGSTLPQSWPVEVQHALARAKESLDVAINATASAPHETAGQPVQAVGSVMPPSLPPLGAGGPAPHLGTGAGPQAASVPPAVPPLGAGVGQQQDAPPRRGRGRSGGRGRGRGRGSRGRGAREPQPASDQAMAHPPAHAQQVPPPTTTQPPSALQAQHPHDPGPQLPADWLTTFLAGTSLQVVRQEMQEHVQAQCKNLHADDCVRWLTCVRNQSVTAAIQPQVKAVQELSDAMGRTQARRARQRQAGLHYEQGDPTDAGPLPSVRPMRIKDFKPGRGHDPGHPERGREQARSQQQQQQQDREEQAWFEEAQRKWMRKGRRGGRRPRGRGGRGEQTRAPPQKKQRVKEGAASMPCGPLQQHQKKKRGGRVREDTEEQKQQRKGARKQREKEAKDNARKQQEEEQQKQDEGQQEEQPICCGVDVGAANLFTSVTFRATPDLTSQPMRTPPHFDRHDCRKRQCRTATCPNRHKHKGWVRQRRDAAGNLDFCHPPRYQVAGCRKPIGEGGSHVATYSRQQRAAECRFGEAREKVERRMESHPGLKQLFAVMGRTGGAHDSSSLRLGYIDLLRHFRPLLRSWVEDKEHAEERQAALQRGRRSMDSAAASMLRPAVAESAPGAPIVIVMGPTPSIGMGNAPSKKLESAIIRAASTGAGGCGKRRVVLVWLSEYHTTRCCFRCGAETKEAEWMDKKGCKVVSTRLRKCDQCFPKSQMSLGKSVTGGNPWMVDRDVQAAWNMALLAAAWWGKQPRPFHLLSLELQARWQ